MNSPQLTIRFRPVVKPAWLATEADQQANMEALGFTLCYYQPPHTWRGTYRMELAGGRQVRLSVRAGSLFVRLGFEASDQLISHVRVWCPSAEAFAEDVLRPMLGPAPSL